MNIKGIEIKYYDSFLSKFKGLMFKKNFNYGIRLRCNGIHTFFMRKAIDVILTDKDNNVLYVYESLKPYRIILPKKNVYYTYELPSEKIDLNIKKIED